MREDGLVGLGLGNTCEEARVAVGIRVWEPRKPEKREEAGEDDKRAKESFRSDGSEDRR